MMTSLKITDTIVTWKWEESFCHTWIGRYTHTMSLQKSRKAKSVIGMSLPNELNEKRVVTIEWLVSSIQDYKRPFGQWKNRNTGEREEWFCATSHNGARRSPHWKIELQVSCRLFIAPQIGHTSSKQFCVSLCFLLVFFWQWKQAA